MTVEFHLKHARSVVDCPCGVSVTFQKEDVSVHVFNIGRLAMPIKASVVNCPVCKRKLGVKEAKEYNNGANP